MCHQFLCSREPSQKLSRYARVFSRKTQRKTSEHGEECETSSTAHCGEVSDSEQCRSDGVESLSVTFNYETVLSTLMTVMRVASHF